MKRVILFVLIVVIIGSAGYTVLSKRSVNQSSSTTLFEKLTSNTTLNHSDNCDLISNSSFRSIKKYEVGLGPNGPAMGYWGIYLKDGKFSWHHSDVGESGTFSCKDNILQVQLFKRVLTGNYDTSRKILLWEDVEYKQVD